jgi:hypothetical protein
MQHAEAGREGLERDKSCWFLVGLEAALCIQSVDVSDRLVSLQITVC